MRTGGQGIRRHIGQGLALDEDEAGIGCRCAECLCVRVVRRIEQRRIVRNVLDDGQAVTPAQRVLHSAHEILGPIA